MTPPGLGMGLALPLSGRGGVGSPTLRNASRILFFGDSLTGYVNGETYAENLAGFQSTLLVRSGGRLQYIRASDGKLSYSNGMASAETLLTDAATQVGQMTVANDTVFVWESPNSIDATGSATAAEQLVAIWDYFIAQGKNVIATEYTRRCQDINGALQRAANSILKREAAKRRIPFIDWESVLTSNDYDWTTTDSGDPHPSVQGAQKLGIYAAAKLLSLGVLGDPITRTFLTSNPEMSGATGTTAPTGFTVFKSAAVTYGNFSYVAASDNGNQWLQTDVTAANDVEYFGFYIPTVADTVWAGASSVTVTGEIEFELISGIGPFKVGCMWRATYAGPTFEYSYACNSSSLNHNFLTAADYGQPELTKGLQTPPFLPVNNTATWTAGRATFPLIYMHGGDQVRVRFRNCGLIGI